MSAALDDLVVAIGQMDLEGLRAFWRSRYGDPPPLRSVAILRMALAWQVQAEAIGGLDQATRRALMRSGPVAPEGSQLGVGATLSRTWQGRRVEVVVEGNGFRWGERKFASLSAAASAIAGSKWNGPRFFGLRTAA
jgi:hypothetical protein